MRILIVEDEKKMAGFLKRGLEEAGYSVDHAASAASAEMLSGENPYDCIVLDIMLPDKTGYDLALSIRAEGYKGPILFLSALSSTKDKIRGLDVGADDYLTKPFSFDELLARVRALLRRHSSPQGSKLRFHDLELDLVKRKVKRGEREIALTAKEFSLLEYFMHNQNKALSRTSIAEHVWDVHFDSDSNVIDVYVNMLRKKISSGDEKKLIHTIVGVGYVLRED
ncbi:MAG: response regulator transcription factor [Oligoflexia bacterium]|nr:response regulator transcription factor [Oligoflexia bacterium]